MEKIVSALNRTAAAHDAKKGATFSRLWLRFQMYLKIRLGEGASSGFFFWVGRYPIKGEDKKSWFYDGEPQFFFSGPATKGEQGHGHKEKITFFEARKNNSDKKCGH